MSSATSSPSKVPPPVVSKKDARFSRNLEKRLRGHSRGVCINRFLMFLILAAAAVGSWYMQTELELLSSRLTADEQNIAQLQSVVAQHNAFLSNFNASVSNANVLAELRTLGTQVNISQQFVQMELNATKKQIQIQLNSTIGQLGQTVQAARAEIQTEVVRVKKEVAGYIQTTQSQLSMQNSFMIYQLAGTFSLLACLISMWHMTAHLRKFHQPMIQRKILAILWMVPIYAITSWFSLVFTSAQGYLAIVKDFYEAYIIYQFLSFCIAVLGRGDRSLVVDLLAEHADHLSPPFRFDACCNRNPYPDDRALAEAVLVQCQAFAMQFVFLRPLTAIVIFVLQKVNYTSPKVYLLGIQNASIFVAFAGLLKFYHAVDKELSWCKPFAKFLCIKGVVFMTFWQGLAISLLANTSTKSKANQQQWAMSAQNFLVCLEMLLFSIAHFYTYPTDEWRADYQERMKKKKRMERHFGDSLAIGDFLSDLKLIVRGAQRKKKKKKKKKIDTVHEDDDSSQAMSVATTDSTNYDEYDAEFEAATQRLLSHRILNYSAESDEFSTIMRQGTTRTIGADRVAEIMKRHAKIEPAPARSPTADVLLKSEESLGDEGTDERADAIQLDEECVEPQEIVASPKSDVTMTAPAGEGKSERGDDGGADGGADGGDDLGDEEDPPTETTSLLGSTQRAYLPEAQSEVVLHPSIFTSMSEMGSSPSEKEG